jgi:hypothetical protein
LTEAPVNNLESTLLQLEVGSQKRVTAATAMNAVSSRSHAIFTITIQGVKKELSESSVDLADDNTPTRYSSFAYSLHTSHVIAFNPVFNIITFNCYFMFEMRFFH